jgi:hypothetical protein
MTSALLLFLCTFVAVFGLGLQSLNVNGGHHVAATLTSIAISASTIWLYKAMPGSEWVEISAYMLGAIAGINASMYVHPRAKAWLARRLAARVAADEHADVRFCGGFKSLDVSGGVPDRMPRQGGTEAARIPPRFP